MKINQRINFKWLGISLTLWILAGACEKPSISYMQPGSTNPDPDSSSSPTETNPSLYLALGDSYTIGQSVDSAQRYPAQTAALLNNNGFQFSGINYIAQTGWTTANLQAAIDSKNPQGPFTAVTLLIGVNDQYQQQDTTGYRVRFARLLNSAIALAGNNRQHVFVLSIPDYGVTPFGLNYPNVSGQIDAFNTINKAVTEAYHIAYIDITAISRNDAGDNTMLSPDGLHPSGKQYAQWAAALAPVMEKALK